MIKASAPVRDPVRSTPAARTNTDASAALFCQVRERVKKSLRLQAAATQRLREIRFWSLADKDARPSISSEVSARRTNTEATTAEPTKATTGVTVG